MWNQFRLNSLARKTSMFSNAFEYFALDRNNSWIMSISDHTSPNYVQTFKNKPVISTAPTNVPTYSKEIAKHV